MQVVPSRIVRWTISILSLLALIACERLDDDPDKDRRSRTVAALNLTGHAIETYMKDHARLPPEDQSGLSAALGMNIPLDGWGRSLEYRPVERDGHPFQLYSFGPTGQDERGSGANLDYWRLRTAR